MCPATRNARPPNIASRRPRLAGEISRSRSAISTSYATPAVCRFGDSFATGPPTRTADPPIQREVLDELDATLLAALTELRERQELPAGELLDRAVLTLVGQLDRYSALIGAFLLRAATDQGCAIGATPAAERSRTCSPSCCCPGGAS